MSDTVLGIENTITQNIQTFALTELIFYEFVLQSISLNSKKLA